MTHEPTLRAGARVGYVLKKFPRLSETFILNELLGLEGLGVEVSVFSLNPADDEPRHAALQHLAAPVVQVVDDRAATVAELLDRIRSQAGDEAADRAEAFVSVLPDGREWRILTKGLALADEVRERGLTHLHAHFMTVAAHTAYIAHLATGVPFSVTAHAKDIYRHGVDRRVFAEVASAAAVLVTVCEANRVHILDHLVDDRANVEVIYNGLPLDTLPPVSGDREARLILGVGRLVEKKGFDVLIEACRMLRDDGRSFRCLIIGHGDEHDALVELVRRHRLDEHVVLAGAAPREEVLDAMGRARILAAPCITGEDGNRDALPTVIIEAMAMGLPVVATPVGGIPEMVDHGREGLIIPERDPAALADALLTAFGDDEQWHEWSATGIRTVHDRFDRDVTIRRLAATTLGHDADAAP